jgi:hypothetical protein
VQLCVRIANPPLHEGTHCWAFFLVVYSLTNYNHKHDSDPENKLHTLHWHLTSSSRRVRQTAARCLNADFLVNEAWESGTAEPVPILPLRTCPKKSFCANPSRHMLGPFSFTVYAPDDLTQMA